jgi:hypothetical protein
MMRLSSTVNPKVSFVAIGVALCLFCYIVYVSNHALQHFDSVLENQQHLTD